MNSNKNNEQETVDFSRDFCSELAEKMKIDLGPNLWRQVHLIPVEPHQFVKLQKLFIDNSSDICKYC